METNSELFSGGLVNRPPDPALDIYLDAFAAVVMRFGVSRTRMADVAREAKVDRTTVFRNAGPMEEILSRYIAREVHVFLDEMLASIPTELEGPELVVEVMASAIERAMAHPVLAKTISDEPDLLGALIVEHLPTVLGQVTEVVATALSLLAGIKQVDLVDADATAEWIARFGVTALLVPPTGDLRTVIEAVVLSALRCDPAMKRGETK